MHAALEHALTALGSLLAGGGGVWLVQHWIRRHDRKQDRNDERDRETVERLSKVESEVEHLREFRQDVKSHGEKIAILEDHDRSARIDLNGIGRKLDEHIKEHMKGD